MKKIISLFFTLTFFNVIFACCGAGHYKIIPLGSVGNKIIVAEFSISRYCDGDEGFSEDNEFRWKGKVNLAYWSNDSTIFIKNIDTLKILECICSYSSKQKKSTLIKQLSKYYTKALNEAKKIKDFTIAKTTKYSYNSKDNPIKNIYFETDTSINITIKNKKHLLSPVNYSACGPQTKIIEIKHYEILNKEIIITTISCDNVYEISSKQIKKNKKAFTRIEHAFLFFNTPWHGDVRDYFFII